MLDLDDVAGMKKLDKSNVYGSVDQLSKQCLHAWESTQNLIIPHSYKKVNKIVMCGMGGSGLAARVIESVFLNKIKLPLHRVNDYDLPKWVDENTLVLISAYSGFTEEPIQCTHQAILKKTKWMAIGAGGLLIDLAKKHKVPYYIIDPIYNPSKQPRLAIGYSVIGQLVLVAKAGVISFSKKEIDVMAEVMNNVVIKTNNSVPEKQNMAKQIAKKIHQKQIVYVAAGHMIAAAHTSKNQMNENAKHFSTIFEIPELNHHLMEGLRFPPINKQSLLFLFVDSNLYAKRIRERFAITEEIVKKNGIETIVWEATSKNLLSQVFEFVQFGGFVNFYLSMLNGIDPAPIPWVDYFKTKLGQPLGDFK